ncbi:L-seryl-tRNA(Sec) selenium transferase [Angustibacter luteus]|uniref:L-seryl-tRNA(Sec) selenium transferase n=1 Tax=Angustibacter luteus TaxID=658456 RepID=A0ABW1JAN5_9ACTN
MSTAATDPRRSVPRTDAVLADPRLEAAVAELGPRIVKELVVAALGRVRGAELPAGQVVPAVLEALPHNASGMVPVINATGVLLHTNLGRAALSDAAVASVVAASGTTDVEFDRATGTRARRGRGALAALAQAVPEAGGVHVVNNGAAALVLAATVLAAGREIVVSRGEMVEIGDGFRLPDLLASTGARLREVGTTNRTALADYVDAVGADTGLVLKVHPSNFVVRGFTASVPVADLAPVLRERGVPLVADLGSGLLRRHPLLPDEPDAATALRAGADLVTGSGDKLLGGPQAGLMLGGAELVERLRRHPLARALRVDKLTLAALEATLRGPVAPVVRALEVDADELRARAERIAQSVRDSGCEPAVVPVVVPSAGAVGAGGAPEQPLPSWAVQLPSRWARPLREGTPSVVGRVERGALLLDLRSVQPEQDAALIRALGSLVTASADSPPPAAR